MSNCTSFEMVSDGDNFPMVDNNETFSMIGGSGGGTMDYSKLKNKPSINGVVLDGNKTAAQLRLASQADIEDLEYYIDSGLGSQRERILNVEHEINQTETTLDGKAPAIINTASGDIASISDGADNMPIRSLVVNIEPVQEGSGYPSPTNVRPITGRTECSVVRTGKNLADVFIDGFVPSISAGELVNASGARSGFIKVVPNTSYTINISINGSHSTLSLFYYGKNKNFIRYSNISEGTRIITPTEAEWVMFRFNGVTSADYIALQLEEGTTATAFEPYRGTAIEVSWQSEAGAVYCGTLDVISGILTVNKKMITYNGTENWRVITGTQQRYYIDKPSDCDTSSSRTGYIISHFGDLWSAGNNGTWGTLVVGGTTFKVLDSASNFTDLAAFKTWLTDQYTNGTPLQIVYPLNSNVIYQLTPQHIDTLLGTNNILADVGKVDVEYPADTKLYIEQLTKPTEDDMTADHAISAGTFFMIGNSLYLATSQIAAGGTITPGTNATQLSLADALNRLNT